MRRAVAFVALLAIASAIACHRTPDSLPPEGQLVLYFDTDAIVPSGDPRAYAPLEPYPLFDHVRFDVIPADGSACDCTRDFDVDTESLKSGRVSFGVLSSSLGSLGASPGTVRARLFRYAETQVGEPKADTTIDAIFALEAAPKEGIVERTITLATEDVGQRRGVDTPLPLAVGRPSAAHVGTWPGGARIDCPQAPREGEVCVPGGAFWMGNILEGRHAFGSAVERLVVVAPYYMKATEVTVAEYRASKLPVVPWTGGVFGLTLEDSCTFTTDPGGHENRPVNCVELSDARRYCQSQGSDLPTEAQYEYAASALRSAIYVWGSDPPTCAGVTMCQQAGTALPGDNSCRELGTSGGPLEVGRGTRDRLALATGTIVDLIGNVAEWARDDWAEYTDPCWSRPGIYVNPLCAAPRAPDAGPAFSTRGGYWLELPIHAAARFAQEGWTPVTGFRCARPAIAK